MGVGSSKKGGSNLNPGAAEAVKAAAAPVPPPVKAPPAGAGNLQIKMIKSPVTAAGGRLFKAACKEQAGNVVVSPLSVVVAMSMAAAGATEEHEAGKEIRAAMEHALVAEGGDEKAAHAYFTGLLKGIQSSDPKVETIVANSVWAQGDVLAPFKDVCESAFAAQTFALAGAAPINGWVEKQTKGMIKTLLANDPPGPAVLLNAVYFKGEWQHKFDPAKTTKADFRGYDGSKKDCMMMVSDNKKTVYAETAGAHLVLLPYGSGRFTGIVGLPKEEGEGKMGAAIDELFTDSESFSKVLSTQSKRHVILSLPRFKVPTPRHPDRENQRTVHEYAATQNVLSVA
mmetsp:Transcript_7368/g.14303  ORF Transcript_7368/g.14303 Transcript_7368/m.14303 type:complete len:341 (+) Transcript_7368:353-1375(+)